MVGGMPVRISPTRNSEPPGHKAELTVPQPLASEICSLIQKDHRGQMLMWTYVLCLVKKILETCMQNQPRRPVVDCLPTMSSTRLLYPSLLGFEKARGSLKIPKEFPVQSNLCARKVFSLFKLGHSFYFSFWAVCRKWIE